MKVIGILGIAAAILAAGAAEVQVSDLTRRREGEQIQNLRKKPGCQRRIPDYRSAGGSGGGDVRLRSPRCGRPAGSRLFGFGRPPGQDLSAGPESRHPCRPGGVDQASATVCWGDNFTDSVYLKQLDAPGKVEVPAHDGRQGGNFGIPNALVITDSDRDALASRRRKAGCCPKTGCGSSEEISFSANSRLF